jgi:hypothetical protein
MLVPGNDVQFLGHPLSNLFIILECDVPAHTKSYTEH